MTGPVTQQLTYHSVILFVLLVFLQFPLSLSCIRVSGALPGKAWAALTSRQALLLMLEDTRAKRSCTVSSSVSPAAPALRYEQR